MKRKKYIPTDEDKERAREKRTQVIETLKKGVEALVESGAWMRYLKIQSRFYRYSFHNTLLILLQSPSATHVASYDAWKKMGRHVRKEEHGISIWVPHFPGKDDKTDQSDDSALIDGAVKNKIQGMSFGLGHVFDISQTEGEPLPDELCVLLNGDDHALCKRLDEIIVQRRIAVSEASRAQIGGANGTCRYGANGVAETILIADDLPRLHAAKTRTHELAHALMHGEPEYRAHIQTSLIETEAESVAYVVMQHFGLDSGDWSFGYLLSHNGGNVEEVARALKESGNRIQATAELIIDEIEKLEADSMANIQQDGAAIELPPMASMAVESVVSDVGKKPFTTAGFCVANTGIFDRPVVAIKMKI